MFISLLSIQIISIVLYVNKVFDSINNKLVFKTPDYDGIRGIAID